MMDRGMGRAADTKKVIGIRTCDIHIHIPSWFPLPMSNTKCVIANRKDERWQIQVAERQSLRAEESERNLRGYCNNCRCINELEKGPHFQPQNESYYFLAFKIFVIISLFMYYTNLYLRAITLRGMYESYLSFFAVASGNV